MKVSKRIYTSPAADKLNLAEEDIFARISECETLQSLADDYCISIGALHNWLDSHDERYMRARQHQADRLIADMLKIADDVESAIYTDKDGIRRVDSGAVQQAKLRTDARRWLAGKMHSSKYGDLVGVSGAATSSPLADAFAALLAKGSCIMPRSVNTIDHTTQQVDTLENN